MSSIAGVDHPLAYHDYLATAALLAGIGKKGDGAFDSDGVVGMRIGAKLPGQSHYRHDFAVYVGIGQQRHDETHDGVVYHGSDHSLAIRRRGRQQGPQRSLQRRLIDRRIDDQHGAVAGRCGGEGKCMQQHQQEQAGPEERPAAGKTTLAHTRIQTVIPR